MQRYTIFFITVNALHVSGFPAPHQELKNCTHSIRYTSSLLAATASSMHLHAPPLLCVRVCVCVCVCEYVLQEVTSAPHENHLSEG